MEEVDSGCCPAGIAATSFTAEVAALVKALRTLEPLLPTNSQCDVLIVTDSQALVQALKSDPTKMGQYTIPAYDALHLIARLASSVHLMWVSSHCGVLYNDRADRLANQGAKMAQDGVRLPVQAAKAYIRKETSFPPPIVNHRKLKQQPDRRATVQLNQLLTGHCPLLEKYLHTIGASPTPTCQQCSGTVEDADHLLIHCPARSNNRNAVGLNKFTTASSAITESPAVVLQFLQLENIT